MKRFGRAAVVSAVMGTALVISGCGDTNVAARFDGHVVTESEVNSAVSQINAAFKPTQPFTAQQALTMFIQAPYVLDYAQKHGFAATQSVARADYPLADPSAATLRLLQVNAAAQHLSQQDMIALSEQIKDLKVTVNPKYGAYDPETSSVGAATPNWLEYDATSQ